MQPSRARKDASSVQRAADCNRLTAARYFPPPFQQARQRLAFCEPASSTVELTHSTACHSKVRIVPRASTLELISTNRAFGTVGELMCDDTKHDDVQLRTCARRDPSKSGLCLSQNNSKTKGVKLDAIAAWLSNAGWLDFARCALFYLKNRM